MQRVCGELRLLLGSEWIGTRIASVGGGRSNPYATEPHNLIETAINLVVYRAFKVVLKKG